MEPQWNHHEALNISGLLLTVAKLQGNATRQMVIPDGAEVLI